MDGPGVEDKELGTRVDVNLLTISGECKFETEEKKKTSSGVERQYGAFSRSSNETNL